MRVVVGRVGKAHGIGGAVHVRAATDVPERRFHPGAVLFTDAGVLTVKAAQPHAGRWLVSLVEITDRNAAAALAGAVLSADVPDDESLDADEYFDRQLIGLEVEAAGEVVGSVAGVLHGHAQDTLELAIGGRLVLVPFVAALVEVDLALGRVVVVDRPGLLDPDLADEAR